MKTVLIVLGVLAAIAVVGVLFLTGQYNGLVNRAQAVDAQWAQVQNVYQRRADLIPNLVATVSGAANFEKSTLTEITEARASVGKVQLNATGTPAARTADASAAARAASALGQLGTVMIFTPRFRASWLEMKKNPCGLSPASSRFATVAATSLFFAIPCRTLPKIVSPTRPTTTYRRIFRIFMGRNGP